MPAMDTRLRYGGRLPPEKRYGFALRGTLPNAIDSTLARRQRALQRRLFADLIAYGFVAIPADVVRSAFDA